MNLKQRLKAIPILSPNVPMAYGEYMTYIEQVYAIYDITVELVNLSEELKTRVENIDLNFKELQDQIDTQSENIEGLYNSFNDFKNEINSTLNNRIETLYSDVNRLFQEYQSIFNAEMSSFKLEVNNKVNEIDDTVNNIIVNGSINAYNPTTGSMTDLNQVLSDIYGALRQDALTVAEFENLDLTCTGFEVQEITAYNFDANGKTFLH